MGISLLVGPVDQQQRQLAVYSTTTGTVQRQESIANSAKTNIEISLQKIHTLCSCSIKPETTLHFFLHYCDFLNIRRKLFEKIKLLDETLLQLNDESFLTVLLFGSTIYNEQVNVQILNASIDYIIDSDRFAGSLI